MQMLIRETVERKRSDIVTSTIETYCLNCDDEVVANVVRIDDCLCVRGEQIHYEAISLECPECGERISDSTVESENLKSAYAAYSRNHEIPLPEEIKDLRNRYELSLREFSRFLGFGEQTVARYERGALPDEAHAYALRQATNTDGAKSLLRANRNKLSDGSVQKVLRFIERNQPEDTAYEIIGIPLSVLEHLNDAPCNANGYRVFDFRRAAALAQILASKCHQLYKTKMQKALYFCDALSCEMLGRSLTGLQYAHADHGPIVDGKDELMWRLIGTDVLRSNECGIGEVLTPGEADLGNVFDDSELEVVDRVIAFVNTFPSANDLSKFSHDLYAWQSTENGKPLEYNAKPGEIHNAISAREAKR